MCDNLDVNVLGAVDLAFEEVAGGARHVAAERLERVSFDAQTLNIGAFHVPNAGFLIESGLYDCDAHWWNLSPIP